MSVLLVKVYFLRPHLLFTAVFINMISLQTSTTNVCEVTH